MSAPHPRFVGVFCLSYFLCSGVRFRAIEDTSDEVVEREFVGPWSQHGNAKQRMPRPGLAVGYLVHAPIFNLFFTKLTGTLISASKRNMKRFMTTQTSLGLLPGGFNEATLLRRGHNVVYVRNRKGFLKYCLHYGYELVPVYYFGECATFRNLLGDTSEGSLLAKLKKWLNARDIPTVFPVGPHWFCPFLPYRDIGLHAVFGSNTRCDKVENPTEQQIDEYHQWYMDELVGIFERNKWRFGYADDVRLELV